jgi:membrane protease YdiL (CAAX protease family)
MSQTSDESLIADPDEPGAIEPGWEEDENQTTLGLRAVFTLLAAVYLLWAQYRAGIDTHEDWPRWIWLAVICNFLIPLGIVWMFFGQGITRLDWLKDQKHNAWNYGFNFRDWRRHLRIAGALFALLLPFLIYFSRQESLRGYYLNYFPISSGFPALLLLALSLLVYMFCWEWFFRGFLLFGVSQGLGPYLAIVLQAALFCAGHYAKPPLEMYSSFAGGLVLGWICWREKSFAPAFYAHAMIHVAWAILILCF